MVKHIFFSASFHFSSSFFLSPSFVFMLHAFHATISFSSVSLSFASHY